MKIVQGDEIPLERGLEHRGGTFHFRRLLEGQPGRIDNFQLSYGQIEGDFYSPRHRHNFEQIRFQLKGDLDYSRNGKLTQGMVGYFPEGMAYGPQKPTAADTAITLVLQCGGASGSGYLSRNEVKAGQKELSALGTFEGGVFRRNPDVAGKRNVEGYQAIWEHVNQRPMIFPKPRYNHPIFMDPAVYDWVPVDDSPGAAEKRAGTFTECGTRIGTLKLDPGAMHHVDGRAIYFVVSGAGTVDDQPFRPLTTVFAEWGETATFTATEETEILHLGLPDLRAHAGDTVDTMTAVAAE